MGVSISRSSSGPQPSVPPILVIILGQEKIALAFNDLDDAPAYIYGSNAKLNRR